MTTSRIHILLSIWLCGSTVAAFQTPGTTTSPRLTSSSSSSFSSVNQNDRVSKSALYATVAYKVNVAEAAPRNGYSFMEWAGHYGIQPENFQLQPVEGDLNWGAVATQPARAGQRALFVPSMLRMFTPNIKQQEFPNVAQVVQQKIDPKTSNGDIDLANHFYLFLKVLKEYELGTESPYYAWLDALPRKFNTAVNFRDVETDCLPPFVKFLSKRDQNNYSLFARTLKEIYTPDISDETKNNMDITKWAFNIVFTRARESFGAAEIIPYVLFLVCLGLFSLS